MSSLPSVRQSLMAFLGTALTSSSARQTIVDQLLVQGSTSLTEGQSWTLKPGTRYVLCRSSGAAIAFRTPDLPPSPGQVPSFRIAGAHTDSPGFRLRNSGLEAFESLTRAGIEVYGSPIQSSWLDRDLGIAGTAMVRTSKGGVEARPVHLAKIRASIPNAAIHLNRDINKGFEYNAHTHLRAMIGVAIPAEQRSRGLLWLCEQELNLEQGTVLDAELMLVDDHGMAFLDADATWIQSPRLDNLAGCHSVLQAFLQAGKSEHILLACFFDHEEIGSNSSSGADSDLLVTVMERILLALGHDAEARYRSRAGSLILSVDAAHGFHPAYPEKMDSAYAPRIGAGFVLKTNVNHRYAGDIFSRARVRAAWTDAGLTFQEYTNRADLACGSTIGPMAEALSGIATLDLGIPLWSMHSIRETAHIADQASIIAAIQTIFELRGENPT